MDHPEPDTTQQEQEIAPEEKSHEQNEKIIEEKPQEKQDLKPEPIDPKDIPEEEMKFQDEADDASSTDSKNKDFQIPSKWDWLPCNYELKREADGIETHWSLQPTIQLSSPDMVVKPMVDIKVSLEREFMRNDLLGWNWHKSWNLPNITIDIKINDSSTNESILPPGDLKAQLLAVKVLLNKAEQFKLYDLGLKGAVVQDLSEGQVVFSGIKFASTSYNNDGVKFHLIILVYIQDDVRSRACPKILYSRISPPIFVDSRKSARDTNVVRGPQLPKIIVFYRECLQTNSINLIKCLSLTPLLQTYIQSRQTANKSFDPFSPDTFEKAFIKRNSKTNDIREEVIENSLDGLSQYFTAPNIRNKVKHPIFLAARFSKCAKIYFNPELVQHRPTSESALDSILVQMQKILSESNTIVKGKGDQSQLNRAFDNKYYILLIQESGNKDTFQLNKKISDYLDPIINEALHVIFNSNILPSDFVELPSPGLTRSYQRVYQQLVNIKNSFDDGEPMEEQEKPPKKASKKSQANQQRSESTVTTRRERKGKEQQQQQQQAFQETTYNDVPSSLPTKKVKKQEPNEEPINAFKTQPTPSQTTKIDIEPTPSSSNDASSAKHSSSDQNKNKGAFTISANNTNSASSHSIIKSKPIGSGVTKGSNSITQPSNSIQPLVNASQPTQTPNTETTTTQQDPLASILSSLVQPNNNTNSSNTVSNTNSNNSNQASNPLAALLGRAAGGASNQNNSNNSNTSNSGSGSGNILQSLLGNLGGGSGGAGGLASLANLGGLDDVLKNIPLDILTGSISGQKIPSQQQQQNNSASGLSSIISSLLGGGNQNNSNQQSNNSNNQLSQILNLLGAGGASEPKKQEDPLQSLISQLTGQGNSVNQQKPAESNPSNILAQLLGGGGGNNSSSNTNSNNSLQSSLQSLLGGLTGGSGNNNNNTNSSANSALSSLLGLATQQEQPQNNNSANGLTSLLNSLTGSSNSNANTSSNASNPLNALQQLLGGSGSSGGNAQQPPQQSNPAPSNNPLSSLLSQLTGGNTNASNNNRQQASIPANNPQQSSGNNSLVSLLQNLGQSGGSSTPSFQQQSAPSNATANSSNSSELNLLNLLGGAVGNSTPSQQQQQQNSQPNNSNPLSGLLASLGGNTNSSNANNAQQSTNQGNTSSIEALLKSLGR